MSDDAQNQIDDNLLRSLIKQRNRELLRIQLLCFMASLNRAKPVTGEALENILRKIRMYDPLLKEDPVVQEYMEEGRAEGRAKGLAEGAASAFRQSIEKVVRKRFPDLKKLVVALVAEMQDPTALDQVLDALLEVEDKDQAQSYLVALSNNE